MQRIFLFTALLIPLTLPATLQAALPKDVRQELSAMTKEAGTVARLVRQKEIDEAREIVARLTERARELNIADDERDRSWKAFRKQLERARNAIPVSFEREVAPILSDNCMNCHGADNPRANLRLDTFAGLRRGGRSGAVLRPGNAAASLVIRRLTVADPEQRMPRNADALNEEQLTVIARWIAGGADFDGDDENAKIGSSTIEPPEPVTVTMADGTETVSFKDDVAPWMVNICLRCHRGDEPRGGFSVVTIEDVLRGGDSGETIKPGDSDNSYIWQLVGLQDPVKMPPGNLLLKRSQALALKTWIDEGAHFDGPDAKATLRSLVPTDEQKEADRLGDMSDKEFSAYRIDQAVSLWKRAVSGQTPKTVTSDNFCVTGDADEERLRQIADLSEARLAALQDQYGSKADQPVWRGRLILFVCRSRFDYEEFNTVLLDRRTPPSMSGHVVITDNQATAYAAMLDSDDPPAPGAMNSEQLVGSLVSQAWLTRNAARFPDWLQQGFGRVEAGVAADELAPLKQQARAAIVVAGLSSPKELFDNGKFGPAETEAIGTLLTRWLQSQGKKNFARFLESVPSAANPRQAIESSWNQPPDTLAQAFIQSLSR